LLKNKKVSLKNAKKISCLFDILLKFLKNRLNPCGAYVWTFGQDINLCKGLNNSFKIELNLSQNKSYSRVRDVTSFNEVGSRKSTNFSMSYEKTVKLGKATLFLNPKFIKGLKAFDALDDNKSGLEGKIQFSLGKLYGYLTTPLNKWIWKLTWDSQYTEDILLPAQKFNIGGQTTVRGFKNDSLAANNGFYLQNALTINGNQLFPKHQGSGNMSISIFVDYGHLYLEQKEEQSLSGVGFSFDFSKDFVTSSITVASVIDKESHIEEENAVYFTFNVKF
jgi:hemolysin activation/secretion protein